MNIHEITPLTPTEDLIRMSTDLSESLTMIDHSPKRREQINRTLAQISFELGMREQEVITN